MEDNAVLSQEGLNKYLRKLKLKDKCMYMKERGIDLCMSEFKCPYQGKDTYIWQTQDRRECKRKEIIKMQKIFGTKK